MRAPKPGIVFEAATLEEALAGGADSSAQGRVTAQVIHVVGRCFLPVMLCHLSKMKSGLVFIALGGASKRDHNNCEGEEAH
jgi:hypothetical protein